MSLHTMTLSSFYPAVEKTEMTLIPMTALHRTRTDKRVIKGPAAARSKNAYVVNHHYAPVQPVRPPTARDPAPVIKPVKTRISKDTFLHPPELAPAFLEGRPGVELVDERQEAEEKRKAREEDVKKGEHARKELRLARERAAVHEKPRGDFFQRLTGPPKTDEEKEREKEDLEEKVAHWEAEVKKFDARERAGWKMQERGQEEARRKELLDGCTAEFEEEVKKVGASRAGIEKRLKGIIKKSKNGSVQKSSQRVAAAPGRRVLGEIPQGRTGGHASGAGRNERTYTGKDFIM